MSKTLEAAVMVNGIIALEVVNNDGVEPEKIAKIVKSRISETAKDQDWLECIPLEHLTNLVRRKIKENELMLHLGDPDKSDEVIREELKKINQDIQKTRPIFFILE